MATMLRSRNRGQGPVRASNYQYAPKFLLYRRGTEFEHIPDHMLSSAVGSKLPPELRNGWRLIARNLLSSAHEREADEVATWISRYGETVGFRIPKHPRTRASNGNGRLLGGARLEL